MLTIGMLLHILALLCFLLAALNFSIGKLSPLHLIALGLFLAGVRQLVR